MSNLLLVGVGIGSEGGAAPLADGWHYAVGANEGAPTSAGGWTSTTKLNDGVWPDETTFEQGANSPITVLYKSASPVTLSALDIHAKFRGTLSAAYKYWNGSAWVTFAADTPMAPLNAVYAWATGSDAFSAAPSASIFKIQIAETNTASALQIGQVQFSEAG